MKKSKPITLICVLLLSGQALSPGLTQAATLSNDKGNQVINETKEASATVDVKYQDEQGNLIQADKVVSGNVGEDYSTEQADIPGYTFKYSQGNIKGQFTDTPQTVIYIYTKNVVKAGNVTAKYVDTDGNTIADDVVQSGNVGDAYSTEQQKIPGYTFKSSQGNVKGTLTERTQVVTYTYVKNAASSVEQTDVDTSTSSPISDQTFNIDSTIKDIYDYTVGTYSEVSMDGSFTIDESLVKNGDEIKVADASITSSVPGLEADLINRSITTIKNMDTGEVLGTLQLSGNELILTISDSYTLKPSKEIFSFSNSKAFAIRANKNMVKSNKDVSETLKIGDSETTTNFHKQNLFDITHIPINKPSLSLGTGETGYVRDTIFDVAYNQAGLSELQASGGESAQPENLKEGDYQIAFTLSNNVIPTTNISKTFSLVSSNVDNKLQTNNTALVATINSGSFENNIEVPQKILENGLSLSQIKSQIVPGVDTQYVSKQSDGSYILINNISKNSLLLTDEMLQDTSNASTYSTDPDGSATLAYYHGALHNRATLLQGVTTFNYIDPTIPNTVISNILDPETGEVIGTAEDTSDPQSSIVAGQSTVKVHYVDDQGNNLDTVSVNYGWPTKDPTHDGSRNISNAKEFSGYTLNKSATEIPGVTLSGTDQISHSTSLTVDYPEANSTTNIYYVYSKNPLQKATIHYIDDTAGTTLKSDEVTGDSDSVIDYTTADKIKDYESKGYTLVSNNFKDGESKYDSDVSKDQTFEVHLKKKAELQKATIHYIDDTAGTTLKSDEVTGDSDSVIDYTTADKIKDYESKGYTLVSNNFKDGESKYDSDVSKDQTFEVHLKKEQNDINPSVNPDHSTPNSNNNTYQTHSDKSELPDTGSASTIWVTLVGILVVALSGLLIFFKRKGKDN